MSYQVGSFCYASQADAAAAACAAVVPSTTVSGASVVTVSCAGVTSSGALLMQTSTSPVDGSGAAVVAQVEQPVQFQPCTWTDYVDAAEVIVSAVLGAWVVWWGYRKCIAMLDWSRGEGA